MLYINQPNVIRLSKLVKRYYLWKFFCFQSRLSFQFLAKFTRQKFIPLHRVFFLLVPHPAQGDLFVYFFT